jgi:hypothetical protein
MDAPKRKAQKSEAVTWLQVHPMPLFFVHLHVSLGQFLSQSSLHRPA